MDHLADIVDVVVIGGSAAGLSAAVALARSRRSVVVVDSGEPRNAPAGHMHNFLSRDGVPPAELLSAGRAEVEAYGGRLVEARATVVRHDGDVLLVETSAGPLSARRVVLATGLRDELPAVPGLEARWGVDVLHCPYCHGWEVRDRRLGVLVTGPMAVFQALLFRQLSPRVVVFQHDGPPLSADEAESLAARDVRVVEGVVVSVDSDATGLRGVRLDDGSSVELDALVVAPVARARAEVLAAVGVQSVEVRVGEHVIGTQVECDADGRTAAAGVWAAGNVTDVRATVVAAAAAGLNVAGAVNGDLVREESQQAVARLRRSQDRALSPG